MGSHPSLLMLRQSVPKRLNLLVIAKPLKVRDIAAHRKNLRKSNFHTDLTKTEEVLPSLLPLDPFSPLELDLSSRTNSTLSPRQAKPNHFCEEIDLSSKNLKSI